MSRPSRGPSSAATFSRWASPPASVVAGWPTRAEPEVAEAHLLEHLEPPPERRHRGERLDRLVHGELEHLADVFPPIRDLAHLGLVAPPLARLAGHVDVLEEVHLQLLEAVALAG